MRRIFLLVVSIVVTAAGLAQAQSINSFSGVFRDPEGRIDPALARRLGLSAVRVTCDREPYRYTELDSFGHIRFESNLVSSTTFAYDSAGTIREIERTDAKFPEHGVLRTIFANDGGGITRIVQTIERAPNVVGKKSPELHDLNLAVTEHLRSVLERRTSRNGTSVSLGREACEIVAGKENLRVTVEFDADGNPTRYAMIRAVGDTTLTATMTYGACEFRCEIAQQASPYALNTETIFYDSCARTVTIAGFGIGRCRSSYNTRERGELDEHGRLLRLEVLDESGSPSRISRYEYDDAGLLVRWRNEFYGQQPATIVMENGEYRLTEPVPVEDPSKPTRVQVFEASYEIRRADGGAKPAIR